MGLILPQEVEVKVVSSSYIHYRDNGYLIPKRIGYDGKEKISMGELLKVHVLDLPNVSHIKVKIQCDYCGSIDIVEWKKVINSINNKENCKITCHNCNGKKLQEHQKNKIINESKINPLYWTDSWLKEEYLTKNRSAQSIADYCGVSVRRIEKYIKLYNLNKKYIEPKIKMPKELLYDLYIVQHMQPEEIRLMYKIDRSTIINLLNEYNIPCRNHSESMFIYYNEREGRKLKSIDNKEIWARDGYREKMKKIMKTSLKVKEGHIKHSANRQGISVEDWDDFLTNKNTRVRNSNKYKEWVQFVFERDNYTCQCCKRRNGNGYTVYLNAHHKENFADNEELRFDINNGITLCRECHDPRIKGSFHNTYGTLHNTTIQLEEYIKTKEFIIQN